METKLEILKCGECGNKKHILYSKQNGDIIVECPKCKSQTLITTNEPKIIITNNFGSGTLCVF